MYDMNMIIMISRIHSGHIIRDIYLTEHKKMGGGEVSYILTISPLNIGSLSVVGVVAAWSITR